jgi:hypothetical protein
VVTPRAAAAAAPPTLATTLDSAGDAAVAAAGMAVDGARAVDDRATEAAFGAAATPLARLAGTRTATAPAREAATAALDGVVDDADASAAALVRAADRVGNVTATAAADDPALKRAAAAAARAFVNGPIAAQLVNATAGTPAARTAASVADAAAGAAAGAADAATDAAVRAAVTVGSAVATRGGTEAAVNATAPPPSPPCGTPATHITLTLAGPADATSCTVAASAVGVGALPGSGAPCDAPLFGRACAAFAGALTLSFANGTTAADPALAAALSAVGLNDIASVGSLEVAVEGGGSALASLDALPRLKRVGGATAPGALFDDAGLYVHASPPPAFTSLGAVRHVARVGGPLRLQGTGVTDLSSLAAVTAVDGGVALVDNPSLVAGVGPLKLTSIGAASNETNVGGGLVIERNARLAGVAFPSLAAVGGQLVVRDNPALAAILLPKLTSVNEKLNATRYGPRSVVIAGNRALGDVAGLLPLARCAAPRAGGDDVLVQLYPAPPPGVPRSAGWYVCTFTR